MQKDPHQRIYRKDHDIIPQEERDARQGSWSKGMSVHLAVLEQAWICVVMASPSQKKGGLLITQII